MTWNTTGHSRRKTRIVHGLDEFYFYYCALPADKSSRELPNAAAAYESSEKAVIPKYISRPDGTHHKSYYFHGHCGEQEQTSRCNIGIRMNTNSEITRVMIASVLHYKA